MTKIPVTNTHRVCPLTQTLFSKAKRQGIFDAESLHNSKMKKTSTPLGYCFLFFILIFVHEIQAQNAGIGTLTPDYKLHIASNTSNLFKLDNTTTLNAGVMDEMYFKTGLLYTGAIKTIGNSNNTARLGFFTYATTISSSLLERMSILDGGNIGIGTNTPGYLLDVNGRMRVRNGGGTAGIYFMDAANANNRGFIGLEDDNTIGLYGGNGAGWALEMNTANGNVDFSGDVSIISPLYVVNSGSYTASFSNNSGDDYPAVLATANNVSGKGTGVQAEGGEVGVTGIANKSGGTGHHYGLQGYGQNGPANNYGVYASGSGGNNAYGIYATASNGTTNWGGYFSGSVYSTGTYQGSDRKLKNDIRPLNNAIQMIKALKPSTYEYKTTEYKQMELPEGQQYGLIADEVKQVFPTMVKTAVQPAKYENDDRNRGRKVSDEVSFEAVNYTAMIPVLIAAMQEQQAMIDGQQKRIEELEARIGKQ